jgi:hypothetical protein
VSEESSRPEEDPTQGGEVGERPGEDPTEAGHTDEAPEEDPTQGREVGERPGEDPMEAARRTKRQRRIRPKDERWASARVKIRRGPKTRIEHKER